MLYLGLDTSGTEIAVVLCRDSQLVQIRTLQQQRQQGEIMLTLLDECLAAEGLILSDLSAIAVVTGPGSFTGLRLGIAAALGLARALGKPLAGYQRFALYNAALAAPAALVLESMREELFVQLPNQAPQMLLPAQIAQEWAGDLAGDGAIKITPPRKILPLPAAALLAAQHVARDCAAGQALPPATPFYLRAPDVTLPAAAR